MSLGLLGRGERSDHGAAAGSPAAALLIPLPLWARRHFHCEEWLQRISDPKRRSRRLGERLNKWIFYVQNSYKKNTEGVLHEKLNGIHKNTTAIQVLACSSLCLLADCKPTRWTHASVFKALTNVKADRRGRVGLAMVQNNRTYCENNLRLRLNVCAYENDS